MTKLSVIIPTFRIGGLDILFHGLSNQSFHDFELILVDGIYRYRKNLVREKAASYSFKVTHIEPFENPFPVCSFCRYSNTGLTYANGEVVVFMTDFTWIPHECLQKHYNAYIDGGPMSGLMGPHLYRVLPTLNPKFTPYDKLETDRYTSDLESGKCDSLMWSIFNDEFSVDASTLDHDPTTGIDHKFNYQYGPIAGDMLHAKNESCGLNAALNINGWDEDLDGTNCWQDTDFGERLSKSGVKWIVDPQNPVYIINPRPIFCFPKRLRDIETNRDIWWSKRETGFGPVNSWNIRAKKASLYFKKS